jgi:hypothetical protein
MKSKSIFLTGCAILFVGFRATAGTVPLDILGISGYVLPLAGGGGGAMATLNGASVEVFCDDFLNNLNFSTNYSANVTTLGTSANLSETRFGGVTSNSWTTIAISDGNTTLDSQDDSFFNTGSGSSSLARYEMVAYLVSLYNQAPTASLTSNNQIQEAIWTIMDPTTEGAAINPVPVNPAGYLEQAASWYTSMNTAGNLSALNSFLSRFEIVSDSTMTFSGGLGENGFQEQIVMNPVVNNPVVTPEPRGGVWILLAMLGTGFVVMRRQRNSNEDARKNLLVAHLTY